MECLEIENLPRRTRFKPILALVAVLVQSTTVHAEPSGKHLLSGEWKGKFRFMGNKRDASLISLAGEHSSVTLTLDLEPSTENYKVTSQQLPKIEEDATEFTLNLSNELFEKITCDFKILNANKLEGSCSGFDEERLVNIDLDRLVSSETETSDTPDTSADKDIEQDPKDVQ